MLLTRDFIVLDLSIQPLHHMWDMTQGQFLSRDLIVLALFIQPLAVHAFVGRVSMSVSVDETLLPR